MTVRQLVRAALREDLGLRGDVTSETFVAAQRQGQARMVARRAAVISGLDVAREVFRQVSPHVRVASSGSDGMAVEAGAEVMVVEGPLRALLTAERTALNFVQRLSGVATLTRRYVEAVAGSGATIMDTRKTTPGWRVLEKKAVRDGGGSNHRMGLWDRVMVKDNHLAGDPDDEAGWRRKIAAIRRRFPGMLIEFEADTLDQVERFASLGIDVILLDNMSTAHLRDAVQCVGGRCATEASGGISLDNVREVAETGVQFISVGALTHSAPAADVALDVEAVGGIGGCSV